MYGKPRYAADSAYAITKSCDGYYYRLGLKMGLEGMKTMVENFDYDKQSGIDLPNEKTSRTPKYYEPYVKKRDGGKWNEIETVFASIGQVYGCRNTDFDDSRRIQHRNGRQNVCAAFAQRIQSHRCSRRKRRTKLCSG